MKNYKLLVLLLLLVFAGNVSAQYDDMYYDPDRDAGAYDDYYAARQYNQSDRYYDDYSSRDNYYDDEGYDYYDNHDYHYTSRIRRFHRPYYGFNFFDPVYVDMVYYDPFFTPFNTVLIYDDMFAFNNFWRYNRWNRWNRFGGWGPGINVNVNFGWGGWNAWDPWGWNSWNRFGWNSWNRFGGGWGGNNFFVNNYYGVGGAGFYCPPTWGNNYVYNTVDNLRNDTHYGPRTSGTTHTPRLNEREVRRETPKDVTNTTPRTSTPGRDITNTDRVQPVDDGRQISGREDARTERIRLFDENEQQGRTNAIADERTQRRSDDYWGRRNGTTDRSTDMNDNRTRVNPNDRSRTNTRTYDNNPRSRNNSIFGTPRNNTNTRSSGRTYDNRRNNTRTSPNYGNSRTNRPSGGSIAPSRISPRSSGSSMGGSRSSSPTRSSGGMGSSRSSGSSRAGSSSSGSRSSSSRRGGN